MRAVLILLFIFVTIKISYAFSLNQSFGGRIIMTKALEIQTLESSGFTCTVPGTTIQVKPIKGPSSYIIPYGVKSKTNTTPSVGQQVIGKYAGKTSVICILEGDPPITITVTLDTINLFGTSKR